MSGEDSRGGGCIATRSTSYRGFGGGEGRARDKYSAGVGTDGNYFVRRGWRVCKQVLRRSRWIKNPWSGNCNRCWLKEYRASMENGLQSLHLAKDELEARFSAVSEKNQQLASNNIAPIEETRLEGPLVEENRLLKSSLSVLQNQLPVSRVLSRQFWRGCLRFFGHFESPPSLALMLQ